MQNLGLCSAGLLEQIYSGSEKLDRLRLFFSPNLWSLFYRRRAAMDHALVSGLDLLLLPVVFPMRMLWRGIRPILEVLARRE